MRLRMPLSLQSKLLRVLQFGSFLPLGAEAEEKADIRIVAATNRNLWQEVQNGISDWTYFIGCRC